jgi:SAM-dependent methyltransferase/sporulation protein YlmC with PRC-barrel domain
MNEKRFRGNPHMLRSAQRVELLEVERVIDLCLEAMPARSVLDVGTGTGLFAEHFAARGLEVAGIDANPAMVEAARQLVPQGRFRHASAEVVPHPDGAFDLVFLGLVLHETDDPALALREARRIARLGAAVLEWPYRATDYGPPLEHRLQPERVTAMAHEAGFARVETLPLSGLVLYRLSGNPDRKPDMGQSQLSEGQSTMAIPIRAEIQCMDGLGGHSTTGVSTGVILHPISRRVTHIVVKEQSFPHTERLVPVDLVIDSTPHQIRLRCTAADLLAMEPFIETEFVLGQEPFSVYNMDEYRLWPYVLPDPELGMVVEHEHIPPGELAVRRGTRVQATDGQVGHVDEFLLDPANMHITHLVLREGHLWGQKDVTIPISEIDRIDKDVVHLKLDRHSVGKLPGIQVHR